MTSLLSADLSPSAPATPADTQTISWNPPAGITARGTVVIIPGRGEQPAVYDRLGRRLSADGYLVAAVSSHSDLLAQVASRATGPQPLVVLGSDSGAAQALDLAAIDDVDIRGVIAAGYLPNEQASVELTWDEELDARTACPVHRGRIADATVLAPGALSEQSAARTQHLPVDGSVPVLFIHGAADRIASAQSTREVARGVTGARFLQVTDGRHDILNDVHHRSVAAEIVQFLEQVRAGSGAAPVLSRVQFSAEVVAA